LNLSLRRGICLSPESIQILGYCFAAKTRNAGMLAFLVEFDVLAHSFIFVHADVESQTYEPVFRREGTVGFTVNDFFLKSIVMVIPLLLLHLAGPPF
jgi:hypothetical protein